MLGCRQEYGGWEGSRDDEAGERDQTLCQSHSLLPEQGGTSGFCCFHYYFIQFIDIKYAIKSTMVGDPKGYQTNQKSWIWLYQNEEKTCYLNNSLSCSCPWGNKEHAYFQRDGLLFSLTPWLATLLCVCWMRHLACGWKCAGGRGFLCHWRHVERKGVGAISLPKKGLVEKC